jgi:hypothetical protein
VNLIGEHTDYNDGFVLPLAIDRECVVRAKPTADGVVRLRSLDVDAQEADVVMAADGNDEPSAVTPAWGRYAAGVVRVLAERGRPAVGIDATVSSTIPLGAGLSRRARGSRSPLRWRSAMPRILRCRWSRWRRRAGRPRRSRRACRAGSWTSSLRSPAAETVPS